VCGILGLLLHDPSFDCATEIYEGLALLQHRGQDACGIVTCGHKGRFYQCKANGMVRDVFDKGALSRLAGGMGVGHGLFHIAPNAGQSFDKLMHMQSAILRLEARLMRRRNLSTLTRRMESFSPTYAD
jgi:glutamine phosphoribosylpyrophosphate amidotransferase